MVVVRGEPCSINKRAEARTLCALGAQIFMRAGYPESASKRLRVKRIIRLPQLVLLPLVRLVSLPVLLYPRPCGQTIC